MMNAYRKFWSYGLVVKARTNRRDYWQAILMNVLIIIAISLLLTVLVMLFAFVWQSVVMVVGLYSLAGTCFMFLRVPQYTMSVRRYRDVGLSGWWYIVINIIKMFAFIAGIFNMMRVLLLSMMPMMTTESMSKVGDNNGTVWLWVGVILSIVNFVILCLSSNTFKLNSKLGASIDNDVVLVPVSQLDNNLNNVKTMHNEYIDVKRDYANTAPSLGGASMANFGSNMNINSNTSSQNIQDNIAPSSAHSSHQSFEPNNGMNNAASSNFNGSPQDRGAKSNLEDEDVDGEAMNAGSRDIGL